jgi:drug/metabolite transporter (DMT)-like permease
MAPELMYAICGVIAFTTASFLFRAITHRTSPLWMNAFKASVAAISFALWAGIEGVSKGFPTLGGTMILALIGSGLMGLNISDWFMLRSYARMGPARTMIVYRFQPLYLATAGYLLLGQTLNSQQFFAVFLLIACVAVLSHEGKRHRGTWDLAGVGVAFAGMMLDGSGVLLSKWSFQHSPGLTVAQANVIRCVGALLGFFAISQWKRPEGIGLVPTFRKLGSRYQALATAGAILGTSVGLFLWLKALSIGNAAQVSAFGGLAPVVAIGIESVLERKWPGPHAIAALILSLAALVLLI